MSRALVTGATGFLGRYILERLVERGDRVRGLCRSESPELERLGAEVVRGDIRDATAVRAACRDCETVFHVAGVAGIWGPWNHYYSINTLGTRQVINGCREHGVRRLVYTSSPSVTFDGGDQAGVDESAPYARRWLTHYPHSKALAEQEVLAANDTRLATCALRPHLIWGPRDRQLVPRLIAKAKSGRLRRVGNGENLIDIIYVENAAAAHLQAADALVVPGTNTHGPAAGNAYFISQGEPVNCWAWIDQLLALAKLPPVTRSISTSAAWRIGSVLETLYGLLRIQNEPPMTRFLAAQLGRSHYFNITRSRRDFGYTSQISTSEGMARLARAMNGENADA